MIIVAVAALIGGRLYHVIDQWALYKDDLLKIITPPYSGLGVYGGIATGIVAAFLYARYKGPVPALDGHRRTGLFDAGDRPLGELLQPGAVRVAHDAARIPIECEYRVADLACSAYPFETTRFHPLFLYESISGVLGALTLIGSATTCANAAAGRPVPRVPHLVRGRAVRARTAPPRELDVRWTACRADRRCSSSSRPCSSWPGVTDRTTDDDPPTFPAIATWGAPGRAVDFEEVPESASLAEPIEPEPADGLCARDSAPPDDAEPHA